MKYLNKTIEYGLYLLVFFLPVQTRWIIKAGFTEYQSYSLYGTDILLVIVILLLATYKFSIFNPPAGGQFLNKFQAPNSNNQTNTKYKIQNIFFFVLGLLAVSSVSIFFAVNKPLALFKFSWLMLGVGLFWVVVKADYSRWKLVWSLLIGLGLQAGLAIWQFLSQSSFSSKWLGLTWHNAADLGASVVETAGPDGTGERWLRAYGGLDHPNMLGGVMVVGVLLLVGEIIKFNKFSIFNFQFSNKSQFLIFNWILLIVFCAALFFSFSRAAWLALAAGFVAALSGAVRKKNFLAQKNILQAMLISGLVFFILFFQFSNLVITRVSGYERLEVKSVNERIESLKSSWTIIKNNWFGGVGLGNYSLALSRLEPVKESFYYQPAHNAFLLVWAETGIFGLLFFMGLILYFIIFNFQFSILVAWIVLLFLDHWPWSLHFGVLFFWLVAGLMLKSPDVGTAPEP